MPWNQIFKIGLEMSHFVFKNQIIKFEPIWNRLEASLESLQKIHVKYTLVCPRNINKDMRIR